MIRVSKPSLPVAQWAGDPRTSTIVYIVTAITAYTNMHSNLAGLVGAGVFVVTVINSCAALTGGRPVFGVA